MTRLVMLLFVFLLVTGNRTVAQQNVEARGITPSIKLEEVIYGHLRELNGKYKVRATELTFAPGAFLGAHHHVGPGIRYVLAGELQFTEGGQTTTYRAGDYFLKRETWPTPPRTRQRSRSRFYFSKFSKGLECSDGYFAEDVKLLLRVHVCFWHLADTARPPVDVCSRAIAEMEPQEAYSNS